MPVVVMPAVVLLVGAPAGCGHAGDATARGRTTTATATSAGSAAVTTPPSSTGGSVAPTATTTVTAASTTAAPTTAAAAGSGGGTPTLCTPTVMTSTVAPGSGASQVEYASIVATNASRQPCVTTGYPGVALLDSAGRQMVQAQRNRTASAPAVQTLVVAPGQRITAELATPTVAPDQSQCPRSDALLVTLPDNTDATRLTHSGWACSATVGAFQRADG